jgi:hypothetical protein
MVFLISYFRSKIEQRSNNGSEGSWSGVDIIGLDRSNRIGKSIQSDFSESATNPIQFFQEGHRSDPIKFFRESHQSNPIQFFQKPIRSVKTTLFQAIKL